MEYTKLNELNNKIRDLDDKLKSDNKLIFISALILCNKANPKFSLDVTSVVDFTKDSIIDQLIAIASNYIDELCLCENVTIAIKRTLALISGKCTLLDANKQNIKSFIEYFNSAIFNELSSDLFLEDLYNLKFKTDKDASATKRFLPKFIINLIVDLEKLDYKKDVVLDVYSRTGDFAIASYMNMCKKFINDKENLSEDEYTYYKNRLKNSIVVNTLSDEATLYNIVMFDLLGLNTKLVYNIKDINSLEISTFKLNDEVIRCTKSFFNPYFDNNVGDYINKILSLLQDENKPNKLIAFVSMNKLCKKYSVFAQCLEKAIFEYSIKLQSDLFSVSKVFASLIAFNTKSSHSTNDSTYYYDFTNNGYKLVKDSGLVDINNEYPKYYNQLMTKIDNNEIEKTVARSWDNFYDLLNNECVLTGINSEYVIANKLVLTRENIIINKSISERKKLIDNEFNNFKDEDEIYKNYLIKILKEN